MWTYEFLYHLDTLRTNLREHRTTVLLSVAAVGFTLLLFASYLLLLTNLQSIGERLGRELQVVVYLEKGLSPAGRKKVGEEILRDGAVASAEFCSPEKALDSLRRAMGEAAGVLDGLSENPLPGSFDVVVKRKSRTLEGIEEVARRLSRIEGVEDVEYGGDWIRRFFAFLGILRWLAVSLGILLLFASVIVISSTLSLGFYARREEIEILRLVGASEAYIRFPFFLEALLQGVGGAILGLALLWFLFVLFQVDTGESWVLFAGWIRPRFLSPAAVASILSIGAFISVVSSLISFARFPSTR